MDSPRSSSVRFGGQGNTVGADRRVRLREGGIIVGQAGDLGVFCHERAVARSGLQGRVMIRMGIA